MTALVRARGATLPEAFSRAAIALLARAFDPGTVDTREVREVRAHGDRVESLLAHFLNECLYVLEVEGFAWRHIEFAVFQAEPQPGGEPMRLHAFLRGQPIASDAERDLDAIAPIAPASVRIQIAEDGCEIAVTV